MNKLHFVLSISAIILCRATALIVENGVKIGDLPEYREYLRHIGYKTTTKKPNPTPTKPLFVPSPAPPTSWEASKLRDSPSSSPFEHFPAITLCKEKPADGNYLGHIFCWAGFALYALMMLSLVIYQIRSILWIRVKKLQQNQQPITSTPSSTTTTSFAIDLPNLNENGQHAN